MCVCMNVYGAMYVHDRVHKYMHGWVNECRYKAVELGMLMLDVFYVWVRDCVPVCLHEFEGVCSHTYMHVCMYACRHACIHV